MVVVSVVSSPVIVDVNVVEYKIPVTVIDDVIQVELSPVLNNVVFTLEESVTHTVLDTVELVVDDAVLDSKVVVDDIDVVL